MYGWREACMVGGRCVGGRHVWLEGSVYVGRHVGGKHVLWLEGGMWFCVFVKGRGELGVMVGCVRVRVFY